jgi:hypothetical protein
LFVAFVGSGVYIPYLAIDADGDASRARMIAWGLMAGILIAFLGVLGDGITGIKRGILVDSRNRISLSKIQMIAWTVLILSAYAAAVLGNIGTHQFHPLNVIIPSELWLAMGISTVSLIGSPLILNTKKEERKTAARTAEYERQCKLLAEQGVDCSTIDRRGSLIVYTHPRHSRWSDLFEGEETGNAGLLDLAKVQLFLFTAILVLVYTIGLGDTLYHEAGAVTELPGLDDSMIALLAVSHAGYLGKKALPKPPG